MNKDSQRAIRRRSFVEREFRFGTLLLSRAKLSGTRQSLPFRHRYTRQIFRLSIFFNLFSVSILMFLGIFPRSYKILIWRHVCIFLFARRKNDTLASIPRLSDLHPAWMRCNSPPIILPTPTLPASNLRKSFTASSWPLFRAPSTRL